MATGPAGSPLSQSSRVWVYNLVVMWVWKEVSITLIYSAILMVGSI